MIIIYTNIIIDIKIETNNTNYYNLINKELKNNNIVKYGIALNENKLYEIKNKILEENKNIEWININRVGMTYNIKFQPKIINNPKEEHNNCDIVSTKDGMITKIITNKGVELVEKNELVKKGDILISGSILFNDEVKNTVCSEGVVYAKTWYTISIKTTKYYENKSYTEKKRYNISINNKKIFKEKYKDYEINNKKTINILKTNVNIFKENEINKEYIKYTEEQLNKTIEEKIAEKLKVELKDNYTILEQKLLKKNDKNSTIELEYFIVVEQIISEKNIIE